MSTYSDWMGNLSTIISPLQLNHLPLPGSHDAGSYGGINTRSMTQGKDVTGQLEAGVRYFDFRIRVDNGTYFSHHGSDESRDNPYLKVRWEETHEQNTNTLFYQVRTFCQQHPGEIVILNLYDFTSVWGQSWGEGDALRLLLGIIDCFGSLLIPRPATGNVIPTYGDCMDNKQQVLVIIHDALFSTDPTSNQVWKMSDCLKERFSEKGYADWSWSQMVDATIKDQQEYLLPTIEGGRAPDMFWVSQAVLGYNNMTTPDGHSQNYTGSSKLNPPIIEAYKKWWHLDDGVQQPNILLMDYSGVHGDFTAACIGLLNGSL